MILYSVLRRQVQIPRGERKLIFTISVAFTMMKTTTTGFDECIGVTRILMKSVGVWPLDDQKSLKERCKFLLPGVLLLFFIIIPQTRKAIQACNDLNLMLEVLTIADIPECVALSKLLSLWFNREGLKKLVLEIARDWDNIRKEEQQLMQFNARLSKWAALSFYSLTTGTVMINSLIFLVTSANTYQNSSIDKSLLLKAYFPFNTNGSPVFEIIFLCQCLGALLSCAAYAAFDGFFVCSIIHFSGQLRNLKHRFRNLVTGQDRNTSGFRESLRFAVIKHQRLVCYTDIIEDYTFNQTFLVQVISISILLCLQGYQFVLIISASSTKFLAKLIFVMVFTTCNIVTLFMYCYIAQIIRDESEQLFYAIYEMRWYDLAAEDAVLLVILMSRCMTLVEITVGKYAVFSLEYFTKVMKTSVGYLSFLLTVTNKLV